MNPRNILGGIPGLFDEFDFERERSVSSATQGLFESISYQTESNGSEKFPSKGSIEFNKKSAEAAQKQKAETERKKDFFQVLKDDQGRAQKAREKLLFEEELNDIVTNLPTEQKNQLLHYQLNYSDRSIYQRAELRRKLIEQRKQAEKQQKQTSIPSPAKQPSAMEGIFEGRSGSQGSGTANLSAQAVG